MLCVDDSPAATRCGLCSDRRTAAGVTPAVDVPLDAACTLADDDAGAGAGALGNENDAAVGNAGSDATGAAMSPALSTSRCTAATTLSRGPAAPLCTGDATRACTVDGDACDSDGMDKRLRKSFSVAAVDAAVTNWDDAPWSTTDSTARTCHQPGARTHTGTPRQNSHRTSDRVIM